MNPTKQLQLKEHVYGFGMHNPPFWQRFEIHGLVSEIKIKF